MKKVYTRFFIYLTCCVLVLSFTVAPAFADDDLEDEGLYMHNYFDYNTAPIYYHLNSTDNKITFPLHQELYVRYVELYVACSAGFDSVSLIRGKVTNTLTAEYVDGGYYRIYGSFLGGRTAWDDELTFVFETSKSTEIHVWSFHYALNRGICKAETGTVEAWRDLWANPKKATMANEVTPATIYFLEENSNDKFTATVYTEEWRKYDYIDFSLIVNTSGIESIYAQILDRKVPLEITYLTSVNNDVAHFTGTYVMIRMDVTDILKTEASDPIIVISGALNSYYDDLYISLVSVAGSIKVSVQPSQPTWYQRIIDTIKDVFSPDDSDVSEAGDKMESAADELSSGSAAFDKVETPDINTGSLINQYVNFNPGGLSILTSLTSNAYVTQMMIVVFTFALCGYIFFGKKR